MQFLGSNLSHKANRHQNGVAVKPWLDVWSDGRMDGIFATYPDDSLTPVIQACSVSFLEWWIGVGHRISSGLRTIGLDLAIDEANEIVAVSNLKKPYPVCKWRCS